MKKNNSNQSGMFNMRLIFAVALCTIGGSFGWYSFASTPSSGTLTPANPILTYDAGPLPPNPIQDVTGLALSGPVCEGTGTPGATCDSYALTVTLPSGYVAQNPNAEARVTLFWTNTDPTNNAASDYDLYVYKGTVGDLNGTKKADWQSTGDSTADPEIAHVTPLQDGTNQFTIKVVAFQPAGETVHVRIELLTNEGGSGGGFPGFGQADPTVPGVPRYQIFSNTTADAGQNNGQGEFNIGYNSTTKRIMAYNGLEADVYRVTPAEVVTPGAPECCLEMWAQKAPGLTGGFAVGLDPILWTDNWTEANPLPGQPTAGARTFVANSTAGTNASYAVTDDDGDSYLATNASSPNASSDHETVGSGPYPASMSVLKTSINHGHAVYYCAQTYPVGGAACQRSDNFGDTFGPSTLMYTGQAGSLCGGIHGHVHVGPDGTVYVPVRDCTGNAGLAVSMDAGTTWTNYSVPNSPVQVHGSDPSIAIDANNKVYIFYIVSNAVHSEGHVHVQVSSDHGATWSKDTDLGISHGIVNSAFPEAIAGSTNRAACGFVGSDRAGDYENINYPGHWYLFMATTYDGGDSWSVTNLTPNDPVQGKGGIWQGGGSGIQNRNLLDFNEVTMDEKGRVLFGYSDGCTGSCVGDPDNNTFRAAMRVARQSGGKTLLSQYDPVEPAVPKPPCLSGTRDGSGVHLAWRVPDNGGADITGYRIFRGTASGNETFLAQIGRKTTFDDPTADPSQSVYYYVRAVNAVDPAGGALSQEVNFAATPGIWLQSIGSRKQHGVGGPMYDVNLPIDGSGIEPRAGDYTVVFRFAATLSSVNGASAASTGTGGSPTITSAGIGADPHEYIVNMSNVPNAQRTVVTLSGVTDSTGNTAATLAGTMGVLIGDTTSNGVVNSSDIAQTQSQSGQPLTGNNFREDVTVSGEINSSDVALVQSKSGTGLPTSSSTSSDSSSTAAPANSGTTTTRTATKTKSRRTSTTADRSR